MQARTLSVNLSGEEVAALQEAVAAGEYATTNEIIREAVRDWQVKRSLRPEESTHLRQLWDEGKASGPPQPLDFDRLRQEARARVTKVRPDVS
jgi:antitoxin ParD1/3/4